MTNEERLACLGYDLVCMINEMTHYQHLAGEHVRIDFEAMMNGFVNDKILGDAELDVQILRNKLGLT